jgi:hypothetical protein
MYNLLNPVCLAADSVRFLRAFLVKKLGSFFFILVKVV